jgi:NAD(P)-dependent dehydrogenase (short-subunit alcohol dehydrogenase family)
VKGLAGAGALVTGAGSGIGKAAALLFAELGAKVAAVDVDAEKAAATAKEIEAAGGEAVAIACDVADEDAVAAAVATAVEAFGRLNVAFNNAGTFHPADVADLDAADWRRVIEINLTGVFHCLKHELRHMEPAGGGAIVNTASIWGLVGEYQQAAYVASKHAVIGLTKSVALDYATRGVRVNAIAPGVIRTAMTAQVPDEIVDGLLQRQAVARWGEPREVAEAVAWLCSDLSSLVTGTVLIVDGGFTAH